MSTHTQLHNERTIGLAIVAGLILFCAPLDAQLGLGLSPMRVEMRFPAASSSAPATTPTSQSGSLTLTNGSGGKSRVRAEILDFFLDQQETPQFNRAYPKESEFSCRNWLSVNPMEVELDAGASAVVRYTVHVPQGATERGYHCAAGFTTLPPAEQVGATSLKTAVRVVAAFYVTIGSPKIAGGLQDVTLERYAEKGVQHWRAVVMMNNPGMIHFRPVGQLEVIDSKGKIIETHDLNAIPVLPKRDQRLLVPLESPLSGGVYTLRVRADIGTQEIQEASVNVRPLSLPGPGSTIIADDDAKAPAKAASTTGTSPRKE